MAYNEDVVKEQAKRYDSFYLYDESQIVARTQDLKEHFPNIRFLYSIKCNSNVNVLRSVFSQGFGADAASAGEVRKALAAGVKKKNIYYSAPGKSMEDIERAIKSSVLIADSIDEIKRIQMAAERINFIAEIGLRINPSFSFYGGNGISSKFGIDEEQAIAFIKEYDFSNIKITGIHVHLRGQELNADILAAYYESVLQVAKRIQDVNSTHLSFVNMGSGMGIPYAAEDVPLDIDKLSKSVNTALDTFRNSFPDTKIIIETGRYIVGKAGVYVTKVADRKVSYGKTYILLKNTLNGFVRPSLARLVAHYSLDPSPKGSEPLFTSTAAFQFNALSQKKPFEQVDLVGNLCTATDVIAEDITMPYLECGDIVVITNAGAYAAVLSPMQFSTQPQPAELFLHLNGKVEG
ncbi:diaminopimelate decarboxylase [Lactonifactor longoviformis]|uniref:Diaminopimelate decarboxylase n=1 Tax=Lactonifactor longoviformis DSM 17459 TaxID=1122155 RepID=A0A1M4VZR0_9CLOT|nr:diaminopimelate decarboxylase [Lactonifactor longoviformis]POP31584.1 diaminopimelate decarboxylase [Lactonifactor longoviformis]SHE74380.1 diaminopimelate decarboxylase [Lactonifactor longoviformis DSM 17459]